jgi:copper chaperone CopZ
MRLFVFFFLFFPLSTIRKMKSFLSGIILLLMGLSLAAQAGDDNNRPVTAQFKVNGVCGMCKNRIETALDVKGVKNAVWDTKTHLVSVTYVPSVITERQLHERVAAVGHDTELVKAPDAVYQKLPGCCRYRDGVPSHHDH